jgi:hypothetical protein
MNVTVSDTQIVGETESTLFSTIQPAPVAFSIMLKNAGSNAITYRFQQFDGTSWVDINPAVGASNYYNTLAVGQAPKLFVAESNYPQVRVVGNATGGSVLEFALMRHYTRTSGGAIPVLNI